MRRSNLLGILALAAMGESLMDSQRFDVPEYRSDRRTGRKKATLTPSQQKKKAKARKKKKNKR